MQTVSLVLICTLLLSTIQGQAQDATGCYQQYIKAGIERYEKAQYAKAAYNFQTAASCVDRHGNNEWLDWLEKALRCEQDFIDAEENFKQSKFDKATQLYQSIVMINRYDLYAKEQLFICERLINAEDVYGIRANNVRVAGYDSDGTPASSSSQIAIIKTCFTVSKNDFINRGPKEVFILITDPNNMILGKEEDLFIFQGMRINYSAKTEIIYDGSETDVCVTWERVDEQLVGGNYSMEIFFDETLILIHEFMVR